MALSAIRTPDAPHPPMLLNPAAVVPRRAAGYAAAAQPAGATPAARAARADRLWVRGWLLVLALLCLAGTLTHTGALNGFLASSRPQFSGDWGIAGLPAEGYVTWIGTTPVLHDADSVLTVVAMFMGKRGPQETGFLDRRSGYAYLASLAVPWAGPYAGYLLVNVAFWWGTAAAAFWLARRRWRDPLLAVAFSLLIATGNGFVFMVGLSMSYVAAYGSVLLALALAEWLGAFGPRTKLTHWLLLGWCAGIASTFYFSHLPIVIFWWVYGARRVPWRYLFAATAVCLGISYGWEAYGRFVVGLPFTTDNSSLVGGSVTYWRSHLHESWSAILTYFRTATIRGAVLGAFPYPWIALAAIGIAVSRRLDREWAAAIVLGGLIPTIAMLSLLPLPRVTFHMYPAVYLLAARGAVALGRGTHSLLVRWALPAEAARVGLALTLTVALGALVVASNLDLLGFQLWNAWFHFSAGFDW